ncbi:ELAV-like protein 2 [Fragariocoptes setiger]|uniref:ELAV-like protein 2 n=1 Tax=Fragariocoptes setiger TaxID=1670756 RepID=A0ABQ7SC99_9ACAR|nr:ELAV-like protein 2 [Fragariocoptes setiger]
MSEQQATNNSEDTRTNLIINYLPQDLTDSHFEDLFSKHGSIKAAKIVRHKGTGESYGFGFVEYQTHEDALKAIESLNGYKLHDKKLKVAFARPTSEDIKNAKLYIRNLPEDFTEEQLRNAFNRFGTIIESKIVSKRNAVAFVLYDTRKEAETAMMALNGKLIAPGQTVGLEIRFVGHDNNKTRSTRLDNNGPSSFKRSTPQHNMSPSPFQQPYRESYPPMSQHEQTPMNGESGIRVQSQYVVPYATGVPLNQYPQSGFGPMRHSSVARQNRYSPFVSQTAVPAQMAAYSAYYAQPGAPYVAMATPQMVSMPNALHQLPASSDIYGHTTPVVGMSQPLPQTQYLQQHQALNHQASPMAQISTSVGPTNSQPSGSTLFVYNIGALTVEADLMEPFQAYGKVLRIDIPKDSSNSETNKGYAFVTMSDRNQASECIKKLNGKIWEHSGKPLQVRFKK